MRSKQFAFGACVAIALGAAVVAGCGGGSGSAALPGPGPNPSPSVAPSPTVSPSPSPSPSGSPVAMSGTMQVAISGTVGSGFVYGPAANMFAVFSCGCFPQAGISQTDSSGKWSAISPAQATPGPAPYVMVAGRNYIVVAEPAGGSGPQGWTLLFEGKTPGHTLGLGDSGSLLASASVSDVYTTAAALYVYRQSGQCGTGGCDTAFDDWNFNAVQAWLQHMKGTLPGDPSPGPNNAERNLLNDVAAQSALSVSLFPTAPKWNPSQPTNAIIATDLNAVVGGDTNLPTPCPGGPAGCTGTPTP